MGEDTFNSVAIVGFHDGSAGQIETWLEEATGLKIVAFVVDDDNFQPVNIEEENKKRVCQTTDFPQKGTFKGRPLIKSKKWIDALLAMGVRKVLCVEPNNYKRLAQIDLIRQSGLQLISAIHPSVIILPKAKISDGVWINAGCIIGYKAEIGAGSIINTGAQIDHHNILEECTQVDPGVVTAGNVTLRKCSQIHTGATIINRIEVGAGAIIGAGSVIIKDVPANCTVVGVPARVIKCDNNLDLNL